MFGFNYKIRPVNPTKGIYKLTPTKGTYAKAFLPAIVIWSVAAVAAVVASREENTVTELDPDHDKS